MNDTERDRVDLPQNAGPLARPHEDNLDRLLTSANLEEPWFKSVARSIREAINPPKLPPLVLTSRPAEDFDMGGLQAVELPWYKSLVSNVKELINPPKLAPLEVTSKPVDVKPIWGAYGGGESKSFGAAVLIQAAVIALMFLIFRATPLGKKLLPDHTLIFTPLQAYKPKLPPAATKAGGGGGGGNKAPTPVSRGVAPKQAPKQFMPPTLVNTPKPILPVAPTITAPAPVIVADNYGDPLSKLNSLSAGQGQNGLGSGKGSGLGSGNGNGYGPGSGGGTGGGVFKIGGEVSAPQIILQTDPEYSEEARKAKYSGSVRLSFVVDEHGLPRDIKVTRPVGLGLDEKAIEAVMHWRFRPGMRGGKAVATEAYVEVNFRLL